MPAKYICRLVRLSTGGTRGVSRLLDAGPRSYLVAHEVVSVGGSGAARTAGQQAFDRYLDQVATKLQMRAAGLEGIFRPYS